MPKKIAAETANTATIGVEVYSPGAQGFKDVVDDNGQPLTGPAAGASIPTRCDLCGCGMTPDRDENEAGTPDHRIILLCDENPEHQKSVHPEDLR